VFEIIHEVKNKEKEKQRTKVGVLINTKSISAGGERMRFRGVFQALDSLFLLGLPCH
jgi:hypothetical protein